MLPLALFRRIVKDYFLICESYYKAIRDRGIAQIEAIDAGRRALQSSFPAPDARRLLLRAVA